VGTSSIGQEPSPSDSGSGLSSPARESSARTIVGSLNLLAAIGAVMWHGRSLIELAKTDARPLLGAGIILLAAALGATPRDVVAAIRAWKRDKS